MTREEYDKKFTEIMKTVIDKKFDKEKLLFDLKEAGSNNV